MKTKKEKREITTTIIGLISLVICLLFLSWLGWFGVILSFIIAGLISFVTNFFILVTNKLEED